MCLNLVKILFAAALFLSSFGFAETPVRFSIEVEEKEPSASPFWVALTLELESGWHLSWINPGDAGFTPKIDWSLPEGVIVDAIEWPTPTKFSFGEIDAFGYEDRAIILARLNPKKTLSFPFEIAADLHWVACNDSTCLPGEERRSVQIPIERNAEEAKRIAALFREARGSQARSIDVASFIRDDKWLRTLVILKGADEGDIAYFCPVNSDIDHRKIEVQLSRMEEDSSKYEIAMRLPDEMAPTDVKGVIVAANEGFAVDFSSMQEGDAAELPFGWLLVFAFLGGLILNLMPCVLPVISLKLISLSKMAAQKKEEIVRESLFFTAGVILSFWLLLAIFWLLRGLGESVGWGFQLQEPLFVVFLATLFFVMGLSLFGLFEMGIFIASWAGERNETVKNSRFGAFFSGVLATLVATPCTGPFLGTAIGVAFTLPFIYAFLLFTMIGFGMASPFLILPVFPGALRYMPKPGAWMETFKQAMGFVMMASVLWLLWVYAAQTGTPALFMILFSLFFWAMAGWLIGRFMTPVSPVIAKRVSFAISCALILTALYLPFEAQKFATPTMIAETNDIAWEPFSKERLTQLRKEGTPVFIDFTAKWCLICQVNHLFLSQEGIQKKFAEKNVVLMKADFTQKDPEIGQEIAKWGRGGVPLYLLLWGDEKSEQSNILPQLLTSSIIHEALEPL